MILKLFSQKKTNKMQVKTLLIDLDATILASEQDYNLPQLECAKLITLDLGEKAPQVLDMIADTQEIRRKLLDNPHEINGTEFSQSWIHYYNDICELVGREPSSSVRSAIGVSTMTWFKKIYKMYDGVKDTLNQIKQQKILVTLGNKDVQQYKIDSAHVYDCVNKIYIVNQKNVETYKKILEDMNLDPTTTIMVGDNLYTDILPAIENKIHGFHIRPKSRRRIEELEKLNLQNYTQISNFNEIMKYLND